MAHQSLLNFWRCKTFVIVEDVVLMFNSHYTGAAKNAQPIAFVGKGITFDSGGISLKGGAVRLYIYRLEIRGG